MGFVKFIMLVLVFWTISGIGMKMGATYTLRVDNLKKMKRALKILETKITYTYDMLPDLFMDISNKIGGDVRMFI